MPELVVRPVSRGEYRPARDVLVQALADDPAWAQVLPDDGDRRTALRCLIGVALADSGSHTRLALTDERVVGVAVWQPVGRYPMSGVRKARALPRILPMSARLGRRARDVRKLGAALDRAFPSSAIRYLQILGVAVEAQGRGVGRRLMEDGLAAADAAGDAVYLETGKPANVAYYERHGFITVASPEPLFPGGPRMWRMRRPASA